jgi:hypothetical protein
VEVIEGRGKKELGKLVNEKGCMGWRPARSSLAPGAPRRPAEAIYCRNAG